MELKRQDLRQAVAGALQLTNPLAREAQVKLSVGLPEQAVEVEHDSGQIGHVLVTLFLNRLQAMPQGGTLAVNLRRTEQGAVVTVQDNGVGIAPENIRRLFDHPSFATNNGGTAAGPGLSVCRTIVEAHHGRLDAASRADQGSIFSLWLPVEQVLAEAGPQVAATP
jgi:signal transduction histidine kinase